MPQTPIRGGGSLLGTPRSGVKTSGNGSNGRGGHYGPKPFEPDLLTELDIMYLKNVVLKFIEVPPLFRHHFEGCLPVLLGEDIGQTADTRLML